MSYRDDSLYKSGTSLEKTDKEEWRDSLLNVLGIELSEHATLDLGNLKKTTLKELYHQLKEKGTEHQ